MTAVTPIRQTPLQALRNIMEVCQVYEDEKNVSAESARQQLPRIRALAAQVIASLNEPHADTVAQTRTMLRYWWTQALDGSPILAGRDPDDFITEREARDAAAVILHSAMTWGIGEDL